MDIEILLILQQFREAAGVYFNSFLTLITNFAVDYYIVLPAMIIFWVVDKKKGVRVLLTWGTALCMNALLKSVFCVYRPWIKSDKLNPLPEAMAGATGYSFPSGHSSSAGGMYSGLIMAYRKHKALCIFAVSMILLTMFSRIYVGVHTPQDVLVGALIGVVAAVIIDRVMNYIDANPNGDRLVVVMATIGVIALLCFIYLKKYPMDYVNGELLVDPKKMTVNGFIDPGRFYGIILGWFIERRFVRFEIGGSTYQKVITCLVGAVLYIFFWTVICDPIGKAVGVGIVYFIIQALCQIIFMTLYPLIAYKLQGHFGAVSKAENK